MAKKTKSWPQVGSLRKSKSGNLYLSFKLAEPLTMAALVYRDGKEVTETVTLHPNDKGYVTMLLKDPEKEIESMLNNGYLTEDEANERKNRLPSSLKYNIIAPQD